MGSYMVDLFPFFDFNKGASGATNIFQVEDSIVEFYLSVVSGNAFIKDQDLIRTVPADLGTVLFHGKEWSLRPVRLLND